MKRPRILIVDDSKPILCLLEVILGKQFEIFAATDGFSAMNWLMEGNRPDMIISDLQMPNIDGTELLSFLSNSSYYEGIPILILSGCEESDIISKCNGLKVSGYLTKPFDPVELIEIVNKVLRNQKPGYTAKNPYQFT